MSTGDRENQRGSSDRDKAEPPASASTSPAPGKVTRASPLSLAAPPAAFGQSRASTNGAAGDRAEPWVMDADSMSAMGLAPEVAETTDAAEDPPCRHPVAANRRAFAGVSASASGGARVSKGVGDVAGDVVNLATYAAAFSAGILEGAWSAVVDLFQGAADMVELVAKSAYHLVTANPGAIKDMLMTWVAKLKLVWGNRAEIADDFMRKWESDDDWTRGNFQGEVLGWVMMTALLIMATSGAAALTATTGRWASVLRLLASVDALGDLTSYVAKLGRLPGKVVDELRGRFGKGAESAADGAASAAAKEGRQLTDEVTESRGANAGEAIEGAKVRRANGGRFGLEQDSAIDLLTDPNPPVEIRELRDRLPSGGEFSRSHDAMVAFRRLIREMLPRRAKEVDSVFTQLQRATGTGLERVPRDRIEEVFDYLFQSHGIQLDYANYAAWRRLSTSMGTIDDLRFIKHELEELKALREDGLDDPTGRNLQVEEIDDWRTKFLSELFLPAHRKALEVELEFIRGEILKRTNGQVEISLEELAMSDPLRSEAKDVSLRDNRLIRNHAKARSWNRSNEKVQLSSEVAKALGLPTSTNIANLIRAIKQQQIGNRS